MARRGRNDIEVAVVGEADFKGARKDAKRELDRIENDAIDVAKDIERAFDRVELSPELDTADIRQALDLADQLDGMVASFDIDTDLDEIKQAEKIARSLRAFQGRVELSVEGREELKEALGLAETMGQTRQVKVQVQGRQDLQRAADLAEDLEQTRTVRVNVDDSDLDQIDDGLTDAGERGADGIADAIGGIDFDSIGNTAVDQLTGALAAAGPWAAAAGAIGLVFGGDLAAGISQGFNRRRNEAIRSITTSLSADEMAVAGEAAGDAWAGGFGESLPQLQADADQLKSILGELADDADMTELVRQSQVLSDVLGVEVTDAAELARRSVKQGLADDWQDAFDDMTGVTQEFGDTGREALDVLEEFGPNFARFEVDGGRAVQFVAGAFRDGLVPTIDRAGEAFEEFTTRIIDGDVADDIRQLGLNFEEIQAAVAAGGDRANDAMVTVIEAILELREETDRTSTSNNIFGQSFEQVTDRAELLQRMLELLGDETDAYAGKAEDAADAMEGSAGAFEQLSRAIQDEASTMADDFASELIQVADAAESAKDKGLDFVRFLGLMGDEIEENSRITASGGRTIEGLSDNARIAAEGLSGAERAMDDFASSTDDAADSTSDLEAAFAELEGRFNASSAFRRIQDQGDRLLASVQDLEGGLFTVGGEFNRADPAARRFEQTLEDMNGTLIDAARDLANGTIETDEFRAAQRDAELQIRQAAEAAGVADAKVEEMIETFTRVPDIDPQITADTGPARADLAEFLRVANGARATVTLDADGSFARNELNRFLRLANSSRATVPISGSRGGGNSTITRRAKGGPVTGSFMVGEGGREILDIGTAQGFVHENRSSERALGGGTERIEIELRFNQRELDKLVRKRVITKGGVDVYFGEG